MEYVSGWVVRRWNEYLNGTDEWVQLRNAEEAYWVSNMVATPVIAVTTELDRTGHVGVVYPSYQGGTFDRVAVQNLI